MPVASHLYLKATCKNFKGLMESDCFVQGRKSCGLQVLVLMLKSGKMMAKLGCKLLNAFLHPESLPVMDSIRIESEELEKGDRPSMSFEKPYYRFLQLRVGGVQVPGQSMGADLYVNGLDPVEAGPLRKAWWAVRSVIDGLAIPPDARILLIGDRRLGSRSGYSGLLALVSTGNDFGVLKCHLDPASLDCCMVCGGGIQKETVKQALRALISGRLERHGRFEARRKPSSKIDSFLQFIFAFEVAINKMLDSARWNDQWSYFSRDAFDGYSNPDQFFQDESKLQSYLSVRERPDLGPWCFGQMAP
eukprot:Skav231379  [mRNA]  locus=scaffold1586:834683:835594:- [translate_table: standard]